MILLATACGRRHFCALFRHDDDCPTCRLSPEDFRFPTDDRLGLATVFSRRQGMSRNWRVTAARREFDSGRPPDREHWHATAWWFLFRDDRPAADLESCDTEHAVDHDCFRFCA